MSLRDYFRLIGAPNVNAGATEADIAAAELRLGGHFPEALRGWFHEADGFDGEAKVNRWRFKSLQRLRTVFDVFETTEIVVSRNGHPDRVAAGSDYVIICDALIFLPFYAVNIRPDSLQHPEVLGGIDGSRPDGCMAIDLWFASSSFQTFADCLIKHPEECFLDEA